MLRKRLERGDYHVAWIAPVSDLELLPSRLMLDEEHEAPNYDTAYDDNIYTCGALAGHNVVIATCPPGMTGNVNAGHVTGSMFKTFSSLYMAVLVGIGGGVPLAQPPDDPIEDVHLGDVVVGWPGDGGPACIYYDSGRWNTGGQFEVLGTINRPDQVLLNALAKLTSDHEMDQSSFQEHQKRLLQSRHKRKFTFPGFDRDRLFRASYCHQGPYKNQCAACDTSQLVQRPARTEDDLAGFVFHRGRIATGNAVIKDGKRRDQIRDLCRGALCIEMEAAGVDAGRPCLVIRGISDYADSHKNDVWRSYAAGNAAVFARELLSKIPPSSVRRLSVDAKPKPHFIVPFGRNTGLVGREGILTQLLETVPPASQKDDCQRTVIEGLGGIGKTQVAIEVAYRVRETHPDCSVFWVPAVDTTMFDNAYRKIGRALRVKGIEEDKADVKALVKEALERDDAGNWLLIIDNADDLLLLTDGQPLSSLPFNRAGSILLTTRNHQITADFEARQGVFRLDQLTDSESAQLLHQGLQSNQTGDPQSTTDLLEYLAYLPLAIKQASTYMSRQMSVTVAKYLEYCKSSDQTMVRLLGNRFADRGRYEEFDNAVATTWLISFEQIQRDAPLATSYLRSIAYFMEKDIPVSLLPPGKDAIARDEAISTLQAYAFITYQGTPDRFDIHRLVRLATRAWVQIQKKQSEQVTDILRHLLQVFPWPAHANRDLWSAYLPHTQAVLEFKNECTETNALLPLQASVAKGYYLLGKYEETEKAHRQILELRETVLGRQHPDTLASMSNLALVLNSQGKHQEAEKAHRQTLELKETVLGRQHPDTLASMNNLANVLDSQGKYEEAEKAHRQTLEMKETVLGRQHPDTLMGMMNIANALYGQGKYEAAQTMHRATLELKETVLGRQHPDTLASMNNLANALQKQGKYEEAEKVHRRTLELEEAVLGRQHPDTLASMSNLAVVLQKQGNYEEAEKVHRQTLELKETVLGRQHPSTLNSMMNIANALYKQGKYEEAEKAHRKTLELKETVLGQQHPNTLANINNLAIVLNSQGRYEEAEKAHRKTLELRETVLGRQHPSTLSSINSLANVLENQGKHAEAEQMHQKRLAWKNSECPREAEEEQGNEAVASADNGVVLTAS